MISEALVRKCITDSAREWGQESAYLRSQRLFTEQCPLTDMLLHIDNTAKIVVNIFLLHWLLQQFYKCIWIYICMYVCIYTSFTWQAIYWWLCMTFLLLHINCWHSVSPMHHKPAHIFSPKWWSWTGGNTLQTLLGNSPQCDQWHN